VDRLGVALESLRDRVRDAVAEVVSDAVGKAVHEVVRVLVGPGETRPPVPDLPPDRPRYEDDSRDRRPRPAWSGDTSSEWEDLDRYEECQDAPIPVAIPAPVPAPRLKRTTQALALGLQTAAWWLRRRAATLSPGAALGLGAVASFAAYLAGPVVALSGAGVLAAALSLLNIADTFASVLSH